MSKEKPTPSDSKAQHEANQSSGLPISASDLQLALSPKRALTWGPPGSACLTGSLFSPVQQEASKNDPVASHGESRLVKDAEKGAFVFFTPTNEVGKHADLIKTYLRLQPGWSARTV